MQLSARQKSARCRQWMRKKLSSARVSPRIRTTYKAVEVASLMVVTSLYIDCQALDLRALKLDFRGELQTAVAARP